MTAQTLTPLRRDAPVPTWFGVGGTADALATPAAIDELASLLAAHDPATGPVRVLGDGANLLVGDAGVGGLVVRLSKLNSAEWDAHGVTAGAGVPLPRLVVEAVRRGLGGLEGLGGIPASLGGAVRMNAGGAFGEIGPCVRSVCALDHRGNEHELTDLGFGYRTSSVEGLVVVSVRLELEPGDPAALRDRLKDVMAHKKKAQPLAARSAGCVFRNPLVGGTRVSAGRLIDQAGAKGLRDGGASVSERHGNFIVVDRGATAADVLSLIRTVRQRVLDHAGVALDRELVVWTREDSDA